MIRTQNGDVTCDPVTVNSTFRGFYKSLYSAEEADAAAIASHLNNIPLPTIGEEDHSSLDAAFTPEEVLATIQSMPNGKCPGPDGFPLEFFKKFWPEIHPIFMPAISGILRDGIPPSWRYASISLLLKKDKNPLDYSSFRPISLLNVDYKIVAKTLAGFVKSRYGKDNVHRALNIVQ